MPRHSRVFARKVELPRNYASVIEARLEEFERRSSFDPDELEAVWADVFPEGMPQRKPDGRVIVTARMQDALEMILRDCRKRPDHTISADDWVLLTRTVLPEVYADPVGKPRPTDSLPGTPEKCQTLVMRAWMQLRLWHDADPCDHAGVEHAVCPAKRKQRAPCSQPKLDPSRPTRDEARDARRGQLRFWHPGMIRLEGAMDDPRREYGAGNGRASSREPLACHAG